MNVDETRELRESIVLLASKARQDVPLADRYVVDDIERDALTALDSLLAELAGCRQALEQASDYCARPSGVCFDPALASRPEQEKEAQTS